MKNSEQYGSKTRLVIDDTTIYEVDMECYQCLSERDKEKYFGTEENIRKTLQSVTKREHF